MVHHLPHMWFTIYHPILSLERHRPTSSCTWESPVPTSQQPNGAPRYSNQHHLTHRQAVVHSLASTTVFDIANYQALCWRKASCRWCPALPPTAAKGPSSPPPAKATITNSLDFMFSHYTLWFLNLNCLYIWDSNFSFYCEYCTWIFCFYLENF